MPIAAGSSFIYKALRRVLGDPEGGYNAKKEGVRGSLAAYDKVEG